MIIFDKITMKITPNLESNFHINLTLAAPYMFMVNQKKDQNNMLKLSNKESTKMPSEVYLRPYQKAMTEVFLRK